MTLPLSTVNRCTAEDIGITAADQSDEAAALIAKIDEYLSHFAAPNPSDKQQSGSSMILGTSVCPNCSSALDGFMGSFQWGMVHGEGICAHEDCGWPCRAKHEISDVFEQPVEMVLAYHPSEVKTR